MSFFRDAQTIYIAEIGSRNGNPARTICCCVLGDLFLFGQAQRKIMNTYMPPVATRQPSYLNVSPLASVIKRFSASSSVTCSMNKSR